MGTQTKKPPIQQPARRRVAPINLPPPTPWWLRYKVQSIILIIISFIFYANTLDNGYAVDDGLVIEQNKYTQKGFAGIWNILRYDSFRGYNPDQDPKLLLGGRYRPLSIVTFAIEKQLWGKMKPPAEFEKNYYPHEPKMSHFINVVLYCGVVFLLHFLLFHYFIPQKPLWAFLATLIFAIHPIHVEAVANIKGRDEILSLLFILLTFYHTFRAIQTQNYKYAIGAGGWFFLALLSKENGLMLLGIMPLTLYFFTSLNYKQILRYTLPIVVVIIIYLLIRIAIGLNLEPSDDVMNNAFLYAPSVIHKYATIVYVLLKYLHLVIWPHPQAWDYSYSEIPYYYLDEPRVWAAIIINTALLGWGFWQLPKRSIYAYGILFYYLSIFIVSSILLNIGGAFLADRFLFQPSIGFAIVMGGIFTQILEHYRQEKKNIALSITILFVIIGLCFWKTSVRNEQWAWNLKLFANDVYAAPHSARTNAAYADQLKTQLTMPPEPWEKIQNVEERKKAYLKEGLIWARKAIERHKGFMEAYIIMGQLYYFLEEIYKDGKYLDEEEKIYMEAYKVNPKHPTLINNIARLYIQKANELGKKAEHSRKEGKEELALQQYQKTIQLCYKALQYDPKNAAAHSNLGLYYYNVGRNDSSLHHYKLAVSYEKTNAEHWYGLGWSYFNNGKQDSAVWAWKECLRINPEHKQARDALYPKAPVFKIIQQK
ncbi:MAG: glycosyltransferase family 39 protein [Bacteroidia bacterium]|nr:glycosyltransferase family 39 protein [Bacteroidia bacterium]MDW8157883.1 glycosyltransferase family 39 protein [Bacteroidia bacterium]